MTVEIDSEAIRARAIGLCWGAGLDPYFWTTVGHDSHGSIREQNWEMFRDQAEEELEAETSASIPLQDRETTHG